MGKKANVIVPSITKIFPLLAVIVAINIVKPMRQLPILVKRPRAVNTLPQQIQTFLPGRTSVWVQESGVHYQTNFGKMAIHFFQKCICRFLS
jgi:hypothetical protein